MNARYQHVMETPPPSFEEARNRRQKVRSCGMHPDYWYPAGFSDSLKPGEVTSVTFWKRPIALFRTMDGELRAIEDRCAHRQLKLSVGEVKGCNLVCPYHGWEYDGSGELVHIPHELFGRKMPKMRVHSYPVRERYGLMWFYPGDPANIHQNPMPEIPELEGADRWACVPLDFTWKAHHSMIMDNVSDFTHEYLHRRFRPFNNAKLTRLEAKDDKVFLEYDTEVGRGRISQYFVDHDSIDTSHMELCYDYPYQWSNTGGEIRHFLAVLPIDERTTRTFFLFHFKNFKVPFVPVRLPRWTMEPIIKVANRFLFTPLLGEDIFACEAEQEAWERFHEAPIAELSPAVHEMQKLTIRKWEEYLASPQAQR